MNQELKSIIDSYPLILPRLYNYLRVMILPLEEIAKFIPTSGNIVDVGCGYGLLDIYLAKTSPSRYVIGSELNGKRVRIAQKISQNIPNVKFFEKNLLAESDVANVEKIDCIILMDLLHHVTYEQQDELIKTIHHILPPGGKLVIKDMDDRPAFKYYWNLVHDKLMTKFDKLHFIGCNNLINKIEQMGFYVKLSAKFNHPLYAHYLLICEKE